jgi:hypothetical protein
LNRKKSVRTASSSSSGGRKMKKKMLAGLMPSQMVEALARWPRLAACTATWNPAPAGGSDAPAAPHGAGAHHSSSDHTQQRATAD